MSGAAPISYRFAGLAGELAVESALALEPYVERFFAGWPPRRDAPAAQPAIRLLDLGEDVWRLEHPALPDGDLVCHGEAEAVNQLAGALVSEVCGDLISLHAASARLGSELVLMPGDSLSGKSTLSLQLLLRGALLFGDDRLLVRPPREGAAAEGLALGLTPRVRLPTHSLAGPAFAKFAADRAIAETATDAGVSVGYLPLEAHELARFGAAAPVRAWVLPARVDTADMLALEPAPASQVAIALLRQSATPTLTSAQLVAAARDLAAAAPAYRLTFGSSARAADLLVERFA